MVEIEDLMISQHMPIFCILETHQKRNHVHINNKIKCLSKMRSIENKKGGAISILLKKNDDIKIEQIKDLHPEVFATKVIMGNFIFKLIVAYVLYILTELPIKTFMVYYVGFLSIYAV